MVTGAGRDGRPVTNSETLPCDGPCCRCSAPVPRRALRRRRADPAPEPQRLLHQRADRIRRRRPEAGDKSKLELTPATKGLKPLSFEVKADGGTVLATLPGGTLAPAEYAVKLDGKAGGQADGLVGRQRLADAACRRPSATRRRPGPTSSSATPSASACSTRTASRRHEPRGRRSPGMQTSSRTPSRDDLPTRRLHVLDRLRHATSRSAARRAGRPKDMNEATRAAQLPHRPATAQVRPQHRCCVGTLDEPGLTLGQDARRRHGQRLPQLGRGGLVRASAAGSTRRTPPSRPTPTG